MLLLNKVNPRQVGRDIRISPAASACVRGIIKVTPDGLFGLLSSASCGAFALTTDQTVVFWNRRAREILGYTPARIVGRRCSGIASGLGGDKLTGDCEEGCLMLRSLRAGLVPGRARMRMRCASGKLKDLVVTPMVVSGVEDGGPLLVYLFGDSGEAAVSADVERLVELGGGPGRRPDDFLVELRTDFESSDDVGPLIGSAGPEWSVGSADPGRSMGSDALEELGTKLRAEIGGARGGVRESRSADLEQRAESDRLGPPDANLTEREREVLSYLALGWETKYIAEELGVSWYTARNHVENLRRKLGASNRLEAVMVAMRLGIIASE